MGDDTNTGPTGEPPTAADIDQDALAQLKRQLGELTGGELDLTDVQVINLITAIGAGTECGASPVTRASGKTSGSTSAGRPTPGARTALTAFAHNARMQSPWAGRLYADARARGKRNPHATRIVARAWLRIIWARWHTNTPYDLRAHLAEQCLTAA